MDVPFGHVRRNVNASIAMPFASWSIPAAILNFFREGKDMGDLAIISTKEELK